MAKIYGPLDLMADVQGLYPRPPCPFGLTFDTWLDMTYYWHDTSQHKLITFLWCQHVADDVLQHMTWQLLANVIMPSKFLWIFA